MALIYIRDQYGKFVEVPSIKGDPGRTPVRGKDYWTPDDICEIKEYINNNIICTEVVSVSADRTLTKADAGKFLRVDAAASITVPADIFSVGVEIEIFRNTSDAVIIVLNDVSVAIPGYSSLSNGCIAIANQYSSVVLKQIAGNVWSAQGAIGAGLQ